MHIYRTTQRKQLLPKQLLASVTAVVSSRAIHKCLEVTLCHPNLILSPSGNIPHPRKCLIPTLLNHLEISYLEHQQCFDVSIALPAYHACIYLQIIWLCHALIGTNQDASSDITATDLNSRYSEVRDLKLHTYRRHASLCLFFRFHTGQTKFASQQKLLSTWKILDLPNHCFLFRGIHSCTLQGWQSSGRNVRHS